MGVLGLEVRGVELKSLASQSRGIAGVRIMHRGAPEVFLREYRNMTITVSTVSVRLKAQ